MQNKEIEEAKQEVKALKFLLTGKAKKQYEKPIETVLQYIDQLETKVKQLGKGQHTLMQSRRKWKNRYYKEKWKNGEQEHEFNEL